MSDLHLSDPDLRWLADPEERHFHAAERYLSLLATMAEARRLVSRLRRAENATWKAKDLLRATGLTELPADNPTVARDLEAIRAGEPLSPILVVRGDFEHGRPLTMADGYHRLSACRHLGEDMEVACRLVPARGSSS